MATGPEHYREAEDWLTVADNAVGKSSEHVIMAAAMVQAHAALALAAAVGTYGTAEETRTAADANAWEYAAGEYTAQRRAQQPEDDAAADGESFIERVDDEQFVEYHTDSDGNHTATLKRYDGADIPEDDEHEDGAE